MTIAKRPAHHVALRIVRKSLAERDAGVNVVDVLPRYDDPAFPLLGQVSERGTTLLNHSQLLDVRAEWVRLRAMTTPDQADSIDRALLVIDQVRRLSPDQNLLIIHGD